MQEMNGRPLHDGRPPPHDDRKGHHYYTPASQANASVYSSDDPCGHHGGGGHHGGRRTLIPWQRNMHKMVLHLQSNDTCHSLIHTLHREATIMESLFESIDHGLCACTAHGTQDHIVTGLDGQHRRFWLTPLCGDATHVEGIGEYHAIVAQLFTEDVGHEDV